MLNTNNINNKGEGSSVRIGKEQVKEYLNKLDVVNSTGPDKVYPRILNKPAEANSEPLTIIFENLWKMVIVLEDWRWANVVPVSGKGKKENKGIIYQPA